MIEPPCDSRYPHIGAFYEKIKIDTSGRRRHAAFYGACALLDSISLKANSHQATITLLHREFVNPGKIERELMLEYTRLFESRMSGDYGVSSDMTSAEAIRSLKTARRFLEKVKTLL